MAYQAAILASLVRRNGLYESSSAIVEGTVGCPASRCRCAHSSLRCREALLESVQRVSFSIQSRGLLRRASQRDRTLTLINSQHLYSTFVMPSVHWSRDDPTSRRSELQICHGVLMPAEYLRLPR